MIRFEAVTKGYAGQRRPALQDVNVHVGAGELVFLVGASGSGKSSFLHLVMRLEKATSGRVLVAGQDVAKLSAGQVPALRRRIGTVFQDFRLLPNKTVTENVAFALHVVGTRASTVTALVPEVLETVGLAGKDDSYPDELSGGEQQRVALARALVNRPGLLLADEPTGSLDPVATADVVRLLERVSRAGTTVVMATHDDRLVDRVGGRVLELDRGRLVRDEASGRYSSPSVGTRPTDPANADACPVPAGRVGAAASA